MRQTGQEGLRLEAKQLEAKRKEHSAVFYAKKKAALKA